MRRMAAIVVVAAAAAIALGDVAATLVVPLKREASSTGSGCAITLQAEAPAGQWRLPDLAGRNARYALLGLAGEQRLLVLDAVPEKEPAVDDLLAGFGNTAAPATDSFTLAYFDRNGNGDLTDDPVIKGSIMEERGAVKQVRFAPIVADVGSSASVSYRFVVIVRGSGVPAAGQAVSAQVASGCTYSGVAAIAGGCWEITLFDNDGNGVFMDGADSCEIRPKGVTTESRRVTAAPVWVLGGRPYVATLDLKVPALSLVPATGATGTLDLPAAVRYLSLNATPPAANVFMLEPGRQVSLPVGHYTLGGYRVFRKDKEQRDWHLDGRAAAAVAATVATNAAAALTFGEPFRVVLEYRVTQKPGKGPVIRMAADLTGAGGEPAKMPACRDQRRGSSEQKAPLYEITDEDRKPIAKGKFEMG